MSGYIQLSDMTNADVIATKLYRENQYKGFRGVPNTVVYDTTKGRARKTPVEYVDNEDMKKVLNMRIKDMSAAQKRTYNRLAQRKRYAKKQAKELSGETAAEYKQKLGKKIKDMTKTERAKYNKLSKREQRLRK